MFARIWVAKADDILRVQEADLLVQELKFVHWMQERFEQRPTDFFLCNQDRDMWSRAPSFGVPPFNFFAEDFKKETGLRYKATLWMHDYVYGGPCDEHGMPHEEFQKVNNFVIGMRHTYLCFCEDVILQELADLGVGAEELENQYGYVYECIE
jgi:hypothetical protein